MNSPLDFIRVESLEFISKEVAARDMASFYSDLPAMDSQDVFLDIFLGELKARLLLAGVFLGNM